MSSILSRQHSSSVRDRSRPSSRSRMAIASVTVLIGSLASLTVPASAEQVRDQTDRQASEDVVSDQRPDRDLEVLSLACRVVDQVTDENADAVAPAPSPTRIHIGCRWRSAEHPAAVGYRLWRIVDRGERELVARGGLDMVGARDVVSSKAHVVRYAVIAVDEHGRRVGQSRVAEIRLHDDRPSDRQVRLRSHNVR